MKEYDAWLKQIEPGDKVTVRIKNSKVYHCDEITHITKTGMFRVKHITELFQAHGENKFYVLEPWSELAELKWEAIHEIKKSDLWSLEPEKILDILTIVIGGVKVESR